MNKRERCLESNRSLAVDRTLRENFNWKNPLTKTKSCAYTFNTLQHACSVVPPRIKEIHSTQRIKPQRYYYYFFVIERRVSLFQISTGLTVSCIDFPSLNRYI